MNIIWLAFITGLTTGGLSCLAVQGGLLTSSLDVKKEEELLSEAQKKPFHSRFYGIGIFLLAKLAAYSVLGFLLGMAGSTLLLTPKILGLVQIIAGLYMLATAARMFELHPIFRFTVIQPPAWMYKFMKKRSRETHWFTPAVLGLLTINGGLGLQGSVYTLQNFYKAAVTPVEKLLASGGEVAGVTKDGVQDVTIDVRNNGYTASTT